MDYFKQFKGRFMGVMQWDDCLALLETLHSNPNDWYLYDTLKTMPNEVMSSTDFSQKIEQIKIIINTEHDERYCGIVYTDDLKNPSFIKIFHPKNLGKVCGGGEHPLMPQWLISKEKPMDIMAEFGEPKKEGFISKYLKF
ncbi:hypothetical protein BHECKSOX_1134 [Bathymodiolus heckerae thiotrophic gill symbiont]|uniref:hypothetical protein n=1 Tax=Bathymodiolus heckerae thiotrophic gill symbiont TaxID=1052212 RepID=UPI0010BC0C80|nr:hypothetical protein [Bathymodiolus heckerae thiotrophic gill symbiont]SHN90944.1 hypothetical protein BHECKSOX_1134 [Bathymodiolus heckerae thiotrophic gill symbiont]